VLALGILSLVGALFLVPLGIVAWLLGSRDLKAMNAGRVDPSGRTLTQIGLVFGIAGAVAWLCMAVLAAATLFGTRVVMSLDQSGNRQTTTYYTGLLSADSPIEWRYEESTLPNGTRVKHAVHWSRDGKKLEEGSYTNDKRDGPWTFWNPDGSVDTELSGVYQNDVKIGPSPVGDYTVPPGSPDPRAPRR